MWKHYILVMLNTLQKFLNNTKTTEEAYFPYGFVTKPFISCIAILEFLIMAILTTITYIVCFPIFMLIKNNQFNMRKSVEWKLVYFVAFEALKHDHEATVWDDDGVPSVTIYKTTIIDNKHYPRRHYETFRMYDGKMFSYTDGTVVDFSNPDVISNLCDGIGKQN